MKAIGIIPSRYASTRFPGKPLALLGGKPIVQWVYERAASALDEVYVATDDERILKCVESFGGKAVMTGVCKSGTDRCFQAYGRLEESCDVIVNIQGDEPFIQPAQLKKIVACFTDNLTRIATLVQPFAANAGLSALENPNSPKVVLDKDGFALYFSRSVVPYLRGVDKEDWLHKHTFYKHIGLYAYRPDVLEAITVLPQSTLELAESLEQLRWLENGYKIKTAVTMEGTIGIDTPADLKMAEDYLKKKS